MDLGAHDDDLFRLVVSRSVVTAACIDEYLVHVLEQPCLAVANDLNHAVPWLKNLNHVGPVVAGHAKDTPRVALDEITHHSRTGSGFQSFKPQTPQAGTTT